MAVLAIAGCAVSNMQICAWSVECACAADTSGDLHMFLLRNPHSTGRWCRPQGTAAQQHDTKITIVSTHEATGGQQLGCSCCKPHAPAGTQDWVRSHLLPAEVAADLRHSAADLNCSAAVLPAADYPGRSALG
jgi:hypothetical protein